MALEMVTSTNDMQLGRGSNYIYGKLFIVVNDNQGSAFLRLEGRCDIIEEFKELIK